MTARATCGSSRTRLPRRPTIQQLLSRYSPSVGGDLLVLAVLQPEIGQGVGRQEGLHLALLDRDVQQIARIGAPVDVPDGIDAEFRELDQEEILIRTGEIADRDDLALEIGELVDARIRARQHPHAAAMGAGGDLDVEALLKGLQPAQRHAETGIEELIGRAGVVDELDIEILLLEEAVIDGHGQRRQADRTCIPRQLQFARGTSQRRRAGRRLAQREFREVDRRCESARCKGLGAQRSERRGECRRQTRPQQVAPIEPGWLALLFVAHGYRLLQLDTTSPFAQTPSVAHVPCGAALRERLSEAITRLSIARRK